jgi:hypothetical protein
MERISYESIIIAILFLSVYSLVAAKDVSFANEQLITIETQPVGFAVFSNMESSDIDGDGDLDIIISQINGNDEISWLENDGGDFTAFLLHIISTATQGFVSLKTIDLDEDGDIDVVGTDQTTNEILWFENDGTATTWTAHVIFSGTNLNNVKDLSLADIDGDGDLDIAVAADSTPSLFWYKNGGNATSWTEHDTGIVTGGNISSITTADITNNGFIDIVYGLTSGSPYITIVGNNVGDGSSWSTSPVLTGTSVTIGDIQVEDLDLDGIAEIYYHGNNSNLIQLTYDAMTLSWSPLIISANAFGEISIIDFDKDGDKDILVGNNTTLSWHENTDGLGGTWVEHSLISGLANTIESIHAADLDQDGDMEIILAKKEDGFVYAYENLLFHSTTQYDLSTILDSSHTGAHHVVAGLLNGDQYSDIVSANKSSTGMEIFFFSGDGAGNYSAPSTVLNVSSMTDSQISAIKLGDMDKDGDLDIVFAADGNDNIYFIENLMDAGPFNTTGLDSKTSSGANWSSLTTIASASGRSDEIQLEDINADGLLDIVALDRINDRIIWLNNDGTWSEGVISSAYHNANDLAVADFDNDGSLDVVVASSSTVTQWFSNDNGDGLTWTQHSLSSHTGYQVDVADMDNDGDIDVIASRHSSQNITWYENDGTGNTWTENDTLVGTGSITRALSVVDINGDGDMDILTQDANDDLSLIEYDANDTWSLSVIESSLDNPASIAFTDFDRDGDLDIITKGITSTELITIENRGGQYSVDYSLPPMQNREDNQTFDAVSFTVTHNGNLLDGDMQISTLHLGFIGGTGCTGPLFQSANLNPLVSNISVYSDDGSGSFELFSDTLVYNSVGPFTLTNGQLTLNLPDQNSDLQITPQMSKDYFITLKVRPTASAQTCHGFELYLFVSNTVDGLILDTFRAQDRDSLIELNGAFTTEVIPAEQLIIASTNNAPTTTGISDKIAMESLLFSTDISLDFSDLDGDALSYSAGGLPMSLSIDPNTGIISGTPTPPEVANSPFTITVIATDPQGASVNSSFDLVINPFVELIFADGME